MQKTCKKQKWIALLLTFITITLIPYQSNVLATTSEYWNHNAGDVLEWNVYDRYYNLERGFSDINPTTSSQNITIKDTFFEYEVVKPWHQNAKMHINMTSRDFNADRVVLKMNYLPFASPQITYVIELDYNPFDKETAFIPALIDPNYSPDNGKAYFEGGGKYWVAGVNVSQLLHEISQGEIEIPNMVFEILGDEIPIGRMESALVNLMGRAEVTFYDNKTEIASCQYWYNFLPPNDIESSLIKEYSIVNLKFEVLQEFKKIKTQPTPDLLLMSSFSIGNDFVKQDVPFYFDLPFVTSLLASILGLALQFAPLEELNLDFLQITPLFGWSNIQSSMKSVSSDAALFLDNVVDLGPNFIDKMIFPMLLGDQPDFIGFITDISKSGITPFLAINAVMLFSLANTLIFPKDFDLNSFVNVFEYFGNTTNVLKQDLFSHHENDLSNIWYSLQHLFSVDKTSQSRLNLQINNDALPMMYDYVFGYSSTGLEFTWNNEQKILSDFSITVYYHSLGIKRIFGIEFEDTETNFFKNWISNVLAIAGIISGSLLVIGFVVKKKKTTSPSDLKHTLQSSSLDSIKDLF